MPDVPYVFPHKDGSILINPPPGQVFLGIAPNKEVLEAVRSQMGANVKGNPAEFNIVSMVESYELQHVFTNIKKPSAEVQGGNHGVATPQTQAKQDFKSPERFMMPMQVSRETTENLGIQNWTQFSTPDRNMMTGDLTDAAIASLLGYMNAGKSTYVHCKSGQGRSASIVVGARVAYIIQEAKKKGFELDRKTLDQILDQEIANVKAARPVVSISPAQKLNLQKVLYARAGLI